MAFDPSIFGLANKPTVALQTPAEAAMNALRLQQATQQGQLQGLQVQQQTQALADANAFRNEYGTSPGLAKAKHDMATASLQEQKAAHDAQKAKIEALSTHNQRMAAILGSAQDQPSYDAARAQMAQEAQSTGMPMGPMPELFDPAAVKQMLTRGLTVQQQLDQAKLDLQKKESEAFGGFHPAVGTDGKPGIYQANKRGDVRQVPGLKPVPSAMSMVMAAGANGLTAEAKQMLVDKYIQTGQLDSDLSARMPGLRNEIINTAAAQAKEQGKGTPDLAGAKKQFKTAQQAQEYFTKGKGADAFRQQETILHHADVFTGIADALQNGNVQAANKLGNALGVQFGSDQATNYKIAGQILSAEVGKYLAGGQSTEAERKELAELIPSFSSPKQMKQGLATLKALVEGQRQSWTVQRDAALKGQVPTYASDKAAPAAKPYTGRTASTAQIKADGKAKGLTPEQAVNKWIQGGGKVVD